MRRMKWTRWAMAFMGGAMLLQSPGCVETALGISTVSSILTAGGVLYLVARVID